MGESRGITVPGRERPRCPGCGAQAYLVVAVRGPARVAGGEVLVSARCGFHARGRGRCGHPVVAVVDAGPGGEVRVRWAFPPEFEAIQGLTGAEVIARWGPERVWGERDHGR